MEIGGNIVEDILEVLRNMNKIKCWDIIKEERGCENIG